MENKTLEFKKGSNLIQTETTSNKIDIVKGSNIPITQPEKKTEFKRAETTSTTQTQPEKKTEFKRAETTSTTQTQPEKKTEFKRAETTSTTTQAEKKTEFKRAETTSTTQTQPEKKTEFKRAETTSTTQTQPKIDFNRGSNIDKPTEPKKDSTVIKKTEPSKTTDSGFSKAAKVTPPQEEPKKDAPKTQSGWRK